MPASRFSSPALHCLIAIIALILIYPHPTAFGACRQGEVGSVPLASVGGKTPQGMAVHVVGEYAYVACYNGGLQIVHIGTPNAPRVAATVDTKAPAMDVSVSGNLAFVAMGYLNGVAIYDVSNPEQPIVVQESVGIYGNGVHAVGNYAYVAGGRDSQGYAILRIIDVSEPSDIKYSNLRLEYNETSWAVLVTGGYAYLTGIHGGSLYMVDVRDPANPAAIGDPAFGTIEKGNLAASGEHLYLAAGNNLNVYDIANQATAPERITTSGVGGYALDVANGYVFAVVYNGLYVQDVSDPANPVHAVTIPVSMADSDYAGIDIADPAYAYVARGDLFHVVGLCYPPQPPDADSDGVSDDADDCADTAFGETVDGFGCSADQNIAKIISLYEQLELDGAMHYTVPGRDAELNGPRANFLFTTYYNILYKGDTRTMVTFDDIKIPIEEDQGGGILCGEYQVRILQWLTLLRSSDTRLSSKRKYRDLFTNVLYGPITAYLALGHQAVVICSDSAIFSERWEKTGIVLDPWFRQTTTTYPIAKWCVRPQTSWIYDGYYLDGFPGAGWTFKIPTDVWLEDAIERHKRAESRRTRAGAVSCKVNVRITESGTGRRLGNFDGEHLAEIPDARLAVLPLGNDPDDLLTFFALPEGEYEVALEGTAADSFVLRTARTGYGLADYGSQAIADGQIGNLSLTTDVPAPPLDLGGQQLTPSITHTILDLKGAVLALQVVAGMTPALAVGPVPGIGGDERVGLEDAVHMLMAEAGLTGTLSLTSTAFADNAGIPEEHTADGADLSPPLSWSGAPTGVQSYVLIVDDPDAPGGIWDHWIVYDIPADVTALPQNAGAQGGANLPEGAQHGLNSWSNARYQGPAPPVGSGTHHYYFRLYALDTATLNPAGGSKAEILAAMAGRVLETAERIGTYSR